MRQKRVLFAGLEESSGVFILLPEGIIKNHAKRTQEQRQQLWKNAGDAALAQEPVVTEALVVAMVEDMVPAMVLEVGVTPI